MTRTTNNDSRDPLDRFYTPRSATYALLEYMEDRLNGHVWEPFVGKGFIAKALTTQEQRSHGAYRSNVITQIHCSDLDPLVAPMCGIIHLDWNNLEVKFEHVRQYEGVDAFKSVVSVPGEVKRPRPEDFEWIVSNPPYMFNLAKYLLNLGEIEDEEELEGQKRFGAGQWIWDVLRYNPNVSLAVYMRVTSLEPSEDRATLYKYYPPTDMLFLPRNDFILPSGRKMKGNNSSSVWIIWDRQLEARDSHGRHLTRSKWLNREEMKRIEEIYEGRYSF